MSDVKTYATVDDLIKLWRPITEQERERAIPLLEIVSAEIRQRAKGVGKDFDALVENDYDLELIARSVVCDVVARTLMESTDQEPLTQFSQSAGGYSVSGTYLVAGGGVWLKNSELKRLGLRKQIYGGIDVYGIN